MIDQTAFYLAQIINRILTTDKLPVSGVSLVKLLIIPLMVKSYRKPPPNSFISKTLYLGTTPWTPQYMSVAWIQRKPLIAANGPRAVQKAGSQKHHPKFSHQVLDKGVSTRRSYHPI